MRSIQALSQLHYQFTEKRANILLNNFFFEKHLHKKNSTKIIAQEKNSELLYNGEFLSVSQAVLSLMFLTGKVIVYLPVPVLRAVE